MRPFKTRKYLGKTYLVCSKCGKTLLPGQRIMIGGNGGMYHIACNPYPKRGNVGYAEFWRTE